MVILPIKRTTRISEAKHDIVACTFVQMCQQLFDAELERNSESGVVGLQHYAYAVQLIQV